MAGRKPLIGVTGPDRGGEAAWLFTWLAVGRAGGRAVRITPGRPCAPSSLDGLILGGGADVDPEHYDQETREVVREYEAQQRKGGVRRVLSFALFPLILALRWIMATQKAPPRDADRDALELRAAREALDAGLPVLGICRGMQLINVTLGGTLHQSLHDFYIEEPNIRSVFPRKRVEVRPDSALAAVLGSGVRRVNALHDQAVDRLGEGMVASAVEEGNSVVQAVELAGADFVLGVQWHPEFLPQVAAQQALFRRLVDAARTRAEGRRQ